MTTPIEREYTFGAAARILDVPEAKLRYWSQSGFVGPSLRRGPRQVYSFQDLISVRAAKELVDRGFQPSYIRKALEQVRKTLPHVDRPLDKLRVIWDGSTLGLVEDGIAFEVTGQRRFDFALNDLAERAARVLAISGPQPAPESQAKEGQVKEPPVKRDAFQWFTEGLEREAEGQDAEAEACYRQALASDPGLAAAHTNLGGVLHRRGDLGAARTAFEAALAIDPEQPEARYNLASILFQQGEIEQAASELRRVVQQSPWFADAHYNLASALERLGSKRQAAIHLNRFIDLQSADPSGSAQPWVEEARARLRRLEAPAKK